MKYLYEILTIIMTLLFIVLKLNTELHLSWWAVFSPLFLYVGLYAIGFTVLFLLEIKDRS